MKWHSDAFIYIIFIASHDDDDDYILPQRMRECSSLQMGSINHNITPTQNRVHGWSSTGQSPHTRIEMRRGVGWLCCISTLTTHNNVKSENSVYVCKSKTDIQNQTTTTTNHKYGRTNYSRKMADKRWGTTTTTTATVTANINPEQSVRQHETTTSQHSNRVYAKNMNSRFWNRFNLMQLIS